jgi:hypothetical protein
MPVEPFTADSVEPEITENAIVQKNTSRYASAIPTARRENCQYAQLEHDEKCNHGRK